MLAIGFIEARLHPKDDRMNTEMLVLAQESNPPAADAAAPPRCPWTTPCLMRLDRAADATGLNYPTTQDTEFGQIIFRTS